MEAIEERLSAQQVADRLGVAGKTVLRWIERGGLVAERRGHAFSIRFADAERVFRQSSSGRVADRGSDAERRAALAEADLLELRGRYQELRDVVDRLEREL